MNRFKATRGTVLFTVLSLMCFFTACGPAPVPYGIWKSSDPDIILIIDPNRADSENRFRFPGVYTKDGVEIDVVVGVEIRQGRIMIYDNIIDFSAVDYIDGTYFIGNYRLRNRGTRLQYDVIPHWQERTGVNQILFELIAEVDIDK